MIRRKFAGISLGFEAEDGIPNVGFPHGIFMEFDNTVDPDIHVILRTGAMEAKKAEGPIYLKRGVFTATGSKDYMVWTHPDIGAFMEVWPRKGLLIASLNEKYWNRLSSIFEQIILPGLLAPFAARGLHAMHASSVDIHGHGIMISGPSGCGKTTAALLLVANGGRLIADDLTFMCREGDFYWIHGMGESPRASDYVWQRFPHWRPGRTDLTGKRSLNPDTLSWTRCTTLNHLYMFGNNAIRSTSNVSRIITDLLSLTYHAGVQGAAMKRLSRMIETVPVSYFETPEDAANLAIH